MNELVITQADLSIIERNLESVAHELTGVINNVNSFNDQINGIEQNVYALNDEVKSLINEIRGTTVVNNARQSIMYNNEQIDKKYGYFDKVRRKTESLLDAIKNSNVSKSSLVKLREELLLNNPNYWLSNALAAMSSWILDDRENTEKEVTNALKKDSEKTCAFFCLINLKLGRIDTSINWLEKYLNNQDPTNLDSDFVSILDLVANNSFGNQGKEMITNKINEWFQRLRSEDKYQSAAIDAWIKYIVSKEDNTPPQFKYLDLVTQDIDIIKRNIKITSSYENMLNDLEVITYVKRTEKSLDEILNNLIYEYEKEEQVYQKDNLKNNLIIEHDGNKEKALQEFEKTVKIYDDHIDLLSLLTNIVMYKDKYKVSNETQKLALSLIKDKIAIAYDIINSNINEKEIAIQMKGFEMNLPNEINIQDIHSKINSYLNNKYQYNDQKSFIYIFIASVVLLVASILAIKIPILAIAFIVLLIGIDAYLTFDLTKKRKIVDNSKSKESGDLNAILETSLAELTDYKNNLKEKKQKFEEIKAYLDNLDPKNFLKTNNERSIEIGE